MALLGNRSCTATPLLARRWLEECLDALKCVAVLHPPGKPLTLASVQGCLDVVVDEGPTLGPLGGAASDTGGNVQSALREDWSAISRPGNCHANTGGEESSTWTCSWSGAGLPLSWPLRQQPENGVASGRAAGTTAGPMSWKIPDMTCAQVRASRRRAHLSC